MCDFYLWVFLLGPLPSFLYCTFTLGHVAVTGFEIKHHPDKAGPRQTFNHKKYIRRCPCIIFLLFLSRMVRDLDAHRYFLVATRRVLFVKDMPCYKDSEMTDVSTRRMILINTHSILKKNIEEDLMDFKKNITYLPSRLPQPPAIYLTFRSLTI